MPAHGRVNGIAAENVMRSTRWRRLLSMMGVMPTKHGAPANKETIFFLKRLSPTNFNAHAGV